VRENVVVTLAVLAGIAVTAAVYLTVHSRGVALGLGIVSAYLVWGEIGDLIRGEQPAPVKGTPLLANARMRRRLLSLVAVAGASALIMTDFIVGDLQVDDVREWIRDLGPWGPVLLITVLAVAMVFAPIPNPPFMIAAGIAWGTFWGVVYCVIGQLIGSAIIFYISHRLGRRFIPRLIGEEGAKRVDQMARQMGPQIVFWWRMMPVSFDFAAYAAGLTGMSFRLFITLVFLGSIVPTTVVVGFGDSFGKSWEAQAVTLSLIVVALLVPSTVFYFKYRESLPPIREWPRRILGSEEPGPA
jgi:uncharacterized membrane protein YdjX (TVP38/TMEM64 family)